uniref:Putative membrane protein n=1 Tax=Lutzomyia longipalpis TaxID=7200 RepID=A0A7G3AL61_LUTLO
MAKLSHKLPSISDTARNYQQQRHSLTRVSMCKNLVALFLLKSILFGMILLTATWSNLNSHFEDTLTMSTFLHSLVILFPTLLMVILSNGFYGASLLLAFYLMLLNRKLSRITEELSSINVLSQSADQSVGEGCTRLAFHQHQLHFSDEIDNIAILYGKVVNYIAKLHEYFTLSVLLIITHSFMNIILELFNIYLALVTEDESINYTRVPIELFLCHTELPGNFLCSSRFNGKPKAVLQQDNVKIRPCGLFPVDYTLITSIICSICSYLVISVQFYMMH